FIGYTPKLVDIDGNTTFTVVLESEVSQLDEIVVIGYGAVRRRDLTGAVASVSAADLQAAPVGNVTQALQGRLPGVNIVSQDGRPDASMSVRVRGGTSITQSSDPLVIIDGIPGNLSDLSNLPAAIIQSIDVLKDASSTAIYGARGANGVILVTTIRPETGTMRVTYGGYVSFNRPTGYFDALSPYDYLAFKWSYFDGLVGPLAAAREDFEHLFGLGAHRGTNTASIDAYKNVPLYDMQKQVYGPSVSQNHDFTVSGGGDRTKGMLSLSHLNDNGMTEGYSVKRTSATVRVEHKMFKDVTLSFDGRYVDRERMSSLGNSGNGMGNAVSAAFRFRPIAMEDIKGDIDYISSGTATYQGNSGSLYEYMSPYNQVKAYENLQKVQQLRGTTALTWDVPFIKGLTARSELSLNRSYTQTNNWQGPLVGGWVHHDGLGVATGEIDYAGSIPSFRRQDSWGLIWSNVLNYNVTLKDIHTIGLTAGYEVTDGGGTDAHIQNARAFPASFTKENAFAMISQYNRELSATTFEVSSGISTPSRRMSFFGRANYSLLDRYLFTVTMRADGSSNFAPANRWGYFPAAAFAWRATEEQFIKDLNLSWLNSFKVRLSYGEVGSDGVSPNMWQQLWASSSNRTAMNNVLVPGSYTLLSSSTMANPDLKWETTVTRNLGFDFEVMHSRLWGTVDLYWNTTKDLLMSAAIPAATGFSTTMTNIGQVSNKGVEVALNGQVFKNKDWNITAGFNINFNKNNIDALMGGNKPIPYGTSIFSSNNPYNDYILEVGKPVGIIMGYRSIGKGFYTTDDFQDLSATGGVWTLKPGIPDMPGLTARHGYTNAAQRAMPGMPKFYDADGDGYINHQDYVQIGNTNPKHTGGFNINARYKGFDLGMFFNWSVGNDVYNANAQFNRYHADQGPLYSNRLAFATNQYSYHKIVDGNLVRLNTKEDLDAHNKNATEPSPFIFEGYISDLAIEDGSFLRLGTLTLGYTLPRTMIRKAGMSNLRVYGTIYNVMTITGYSGLDPEVNTRGMTGWQGANMPTPGLDFGSYPRPRQFVLGLNVTF
ncbi:MAG: SusC/RagA family TonB-linked outer membrane protein, partial [Bacteroidales bacterium]|nr:SusC/RagA family TonB-linked outer membrane protein [Bacteroidales bacterium]